MKMKRNSSTKPIPPRATRREALVGLGGLAAQLALNKPAFAVPQRRFLHLFLMGGWDSALATDPVIGSKASSSTYAAEHKARQSEAVPGKANIILGEGLLGLKNALQNVNVALVNGMYVEVTGHDLATQYLLSGKFTLSRASNDPTLAALLSTAQSGFPAHCVLGADVPLGDTAETHPPLAATALDGITGAVKRPLQGFLVEPSFRAAEAAATKLDQLRYGTSNTASLHKAWGASQTSAMNLYGANLADSLKLDAETLSRYGASQQTDIGGQLAGVFLLLKANLAPYVTVLNGNYDTHQTGSSEQISQLAATSTALSVLLDDLRNTPDPLAPGASLLDNTTILISSEFVRTPDFNRFGGTDHWQSASAILLGSDVKDNTVIGGTADDASALGWDGNSTVVRTDQNTLRAEHLHAAVLRSFGHNPLSHGFTLEALDGLFI